MADFELYYWPVPFRGQFVRAVLAYAGKTWTESDGSRIAELMAGSVADLPVPFIGPPMLIDRKAGFAIAQMPAIVLYLGDTLGLLPTAPTLRAMTTKVINDANDVIDDLTLDGGREMWTREKWQAFIPRLERWMSIWEETGRRHGLGATSGFLLGGAAPGLADLVTTTLWTTMADRFQPIASRLETSAPSTAALARRIADLPPLAALAAVARQTYGDAYCGGQIERSLRDVLGG